jgi:serine-type D-Ala-D-Ala carboxypeptidase/endopeptidase (penicillin-binding protein 4)
MKPLRSLLILAATVFFSTGLWQDIHGQVSPEIEQFIDRSRAANAFWAVQVRDSSGTVLEDLNGERLIRPASNLKLVSSGAFLETFGPEYRFETTLYGRGEQDGNVWRGDLVIKGSGDPSISGDFYDDPLVLFEKWYQLFDSLGVDQIDGNIVGFDGLFDDVPYPKGWEWDDLSYYYAPEISALSFNGNVVDLEVVADGSIGSQPTIHWFPFNTPYVEFINEQVITPPNTRFNESYRRILGTNTILLRSTLPRGYYETEPLSVSSPTLYFVDTFSRFLSRGGIRVRGQVLTDSDYYLWSDDDLEVLDVHRSVPLYEMVKHLNRESDNFVTEMLTKKLAVKRYDVQGSTDLGLNVLRNFMHTAGFDTLNVTLRDASGMAPATLLNVSDLNRYLVDVQQKEWFPYFYDSMAVGGVNGTLGHRFRNSSVNEKFYGKSGFVSGVRTLSGYLQTQSGQQLAVTIATNNFAARTPHVDWVHERILNYLYNAY